MWTKRQNIKQVDKLARRMYYTKDLTALATWLFCASNSRKEIVDENTGVSGNIVLQRVEDVKLYESIGNLKERFSSVHDVANGKENKYEELQEKYRHTFVTYENQSKISTILKTQVSFLKQKVSQL